VCVWGVLARPHRRGQPTECLRACPAGASRRWQWRDMRAEPYASTRQAPTSPRRQCHLESRAVQKTENGTTAPKNIGWRYCFGHERLISEKKSRICGQGMRKEENRKTGWSYCRLSTPTDTGGARMRSRFFAALLGAVIVTACTETLPPAPFANDQEPSFAKAPSVPDPTATVKIPLDDAALSLKSDQAFSDGTYSVYANGVCGVSATIFLGGSGDMVLLGGNPRNSPNGCTSYPRKYT